jgi:CheY-like chemotaxis protein
VHVLNGQIALDYLAGKPPFSDRVQYPLPDLLLCDLKMPGTDGLDLLGRLQSIRELKALPVIVLSSSLLESDAQKARGLGAREYLTKPVDINECRELVVGLHRRWLGDGSTSAPKS